MFISSTDMMADKSLSSKLKSWSAALNVAAKSSEARVFKLNGPCSHTVRLRRGSPQGYTFMGGEGFRLSSVVLDRELARDGIKISVIFNPADLKMAGEFSSLTLPLDEALENFSELEEWAKVAMLDTDAKHSERAREEAIKATIPEVEADWGSW